MLSKNFEVDDLVWAKMKGFPPWPAKIIDPPADSKSPRKKGQHYVYFFGSNNHAWILDENIFPHNEQMIQKANKKKLSTAFKSAIESIINCGRSNENKSKSSEIEKDVIEIDLVKDVSKTKPIETPEHVKKVKVVQKSKGQQNKKNVSIQKTSLKRQSLHSRLQSFKRKYSSFCKDEGVKDSLSYRSSKLLKSSFTEQSSVSPDNETKNEVVLLKYREPTLKRIGFLGLSPMNKGIVNHLLQSGHTVSVWNKTLETCDFVGAAASKCSTPAEVVENSDVIFCCAADSESAKIAIFDKNGVLSALDECGEGKGYVEMTTFDPNTSEDLSEVIKRTGAKYLEAPFGGSRKEIESGEVCILAAGDRALFSDCESCFHAIAKRVFFISEKIGNASRMNLITNMLNGTAYAALAEAMALAERLRIPDTAFLRVLQEGNLRCPGLLEKANAIVKRNFVTDVPLKNVQRDMSLALLIGSDVDRPSPVTAAANEVYKHAKLLRYSDYDVSAVYQGIKY